MIFISSARMTFGDPDNSVLQQVKKVSTEMMIGQRMVQDIGLSLKTKIVECH